jgi:hypothetical protein
MTLNYTTLNYNHLLEHPGYLLSSEDCLPVMHRKNVLGKSIYLGLRDNTPLLNGLPGVLAPWPSLLVIACNRKKSQGHTFWQLVLDHRSIASKLGLLETQQKLNAIQAATSSHVALHFIELHCMTLHCIHTYMHTCMHTKALEQQWDSEYEADHEKAHESLH